MAQAESRRERLQTFGRQRGHRLRSRQARLLAEKLPELKIPPSEFGSFDPLRLFTSPVQAVWLEIGFGAGEHLIWQARNNPDMGFLAAEPYVNGIAKLLAAIEDHGLTNVRIHDDDARDLLEWLARESLARIFILFPDPWPKSRHHKRRLIEQRTIASLARVMAPQSQLRIASDIADYQRWIMEHFYAGEEFEWLAERAADWRHRPSDWPATRYEAKAIAAGRKPAYLAFRRH